MARDDYLQKVIDAMKNYGHDVVLATKDKRNGTIVTEALGQAVGNTD